MKLKMMKTFQQKATCFCGHPLHLHLSLPIRHFTNSNNNSSAPPPSSFAPILALRLPSSSYSLLAHSLHHHPLGLSLIIQQNTKQNRRGMCLFSLFDRINARLGHFIAAHPLWHILASLALIFILSIHLLNINIGQ